jgi:dienelactone hydrolase
LGTVVDHENRGLVGHIKDVTRRFAKMALRRSESTL